MHHIFINEENINWNENVVTLTKDDDCFNHLVNVLRIKFGELVLCSVTPCKISFDYRCSVVSITDDEVNLHIDEKVENRELPIKINLFQGIAKGDKMEFIIEKAVELGVYSITPIAMEYSIAEINEKKVLSKIERFNKIAKSAAEQSKRGIIPTVEKPMTFKKFVDREKGSINILFYENANGIVETKKVIERMKKDKIEKINVIIGPEGGFSENEIDLAKTINMNILSLGSRILRTETAAVTALSILMYELQN